MKNWTQRYVTWAPHNQGDMALSFHDMAWNFGARHICHEVTWNAAEPLIHCKVTWSFQALHRTETSHFEALHNCHEGTLNFGEEEQIHPKAVWKEDVMGLWTATPDTNVQMAPENSCLSHQNLLLHESLQSHQSLSSDSDGWKAQGVVEWNYEVVCYCQIEHFEVATDGRSEVAAVPWSSQPEDEAKGGVVTMAT